MRATSFNSSGRSSFALRHKAKQRREFWNGHDNGLIRGERFWAEPLGEWQACLGSGCKRKKTASSRSRLGQTAILKGFPATSSVNLKEAFTPLVLQLKHPT